ncbi:hypothetical protein ACVBEE_06205 [Acinetobacter sp. ANC 3781]
MNFPQVLLIAGWVALSASAALAADQPIAAKVGSEQASSTADKNAIASAMSAAPKKVAAAATIVAIGANGRMRILRKGNNGFTCMPDNPTTPGPDPMCMDKAALEWAEAWMSHKPPTVGKIGFMYMLAGGTDASNVDPYAKKPTAGNHWVKTGPHVMIVGAESRFYDMYPNHAQPDTAVPYVMWHGTPYQHLMIPVK